MATIPTKEGSGGKLTRRARRPTTGRLDAPRENGGAASVGFIEGSGEAFTNPTPPLLPVAPPGHAGPIKEGSGSTIGAVQPPSGAETCAGRFARPPVTMFAAHPRFIPHPTDAADLACAGQGWNSGARAEGRSPRGRSSRRVDEGEPLIPYRRTQSAGKGRVEKSFQPNGFAGMAAGPTGSVSFRTSSPLRPTPR